MARRSTGFRDLYPYHACFIPYICPCQSYMPLVSCSSEKLCQYLLWVGSSLQLIRKSSDHVDCGTVTIEPQEKKKTCLVIIIVPFTVSKLTGMWWLSLITSPKP